MVLHSRAPVATERHFTIAERWGAILLAVVVLAWGLGMVAGFRVALTLLTVVGFAATIAGFRWPVIGVLGVGILCTIDPVTRALLLSGGILRWNTLNYVLILYVVVNLGTFFRLRGTIVRLQQAFAVVLICWLLITPSMEEGLSHLLNFVSSFALMIFFVRSTADRDVWFWMALVNGVLAGIGGFLLVKQLSSLPYINPNAWVLFPIAGIASAAMAFYLPLTRTKQAILGVVTLLDAAVVYLSSSRGGLLTSVVLLLFMFFRLKSFSLRLALASFAVVVLIIVGSMFAELDQFTAQRLGKLFNSEESFRDRTSGRSYLALGGWYIFQSHPLGVGTGGYATAWANIGWVEGLTTDNAYGEKKSAHAGWIKVLVENGVPGILVFIAYVGSFAGVGWANRRKGRLWIGLLVTCVFTVALTTTEFQSKALWFLASGGTVLLYLRSEAENSDSVHAKRGDEIRRIMIGGVSHG
jgi:hypothetical protein